MAAVVSFLDTLAAFVVLCWRVVVCVSPTNRLQLVSVWYTRVADTGHSIVAWCRPLLHIFGLSVCVCVCSSSIGAASDCSDCCPQCAGMAC